MNCNNHFVKVRQTRRNSSYILKTLRRVSQEKVNAAGIKRVFETSIIFDRIFKVS